MAVKELRKESEIPNISKEDDYRAFLFATKGVNGVVSDFLNECSSQNLTDKLHINSGEIIFKGMQWQIDGNGVDVEIPNIYGTNYFCVGAAKNEISNEIIVSAYAYGEGSIDAWNIVNDEDTNTFWLYIVKATSGQIDSVEKVFKKIKSKASYDDEGFEISATHYLKNSSFQKYFPTSANGYILSKKYPIISIDSNRLLNSGDVIEADFLGLQMLAGDLGDRLPENMKLQIIWASKTDSDEYGYKTFVTSEIHIASSVHIQPFSFGSILGSTDGDEFTIRKLNLNIDYKWGLNPQIAVQYLSIMDLKITPTTTALSSLCKIEKTSKFEQIYVKEMNLCFDY